MCWHFCKCKQMFWLWVSTGWGLKAIHPLKLHCTKAFRPYSIQQDETRNSSSAWSHLTSLTFVLVFYLSFHILSPKDAPWERKEESLQHTKRVTKNSNYVLQWSTTDETGAGGALKPPNATVHTAEHCTALHITALSIRHHNCTLQSWTFSC